MYLIIRGDGAVMGSNYNCAPSVPAGWIVREWHGAEPPIHNPDEGIESYDPTLGLKPDDPQLVSEMSYLQQRVDELEVAFQNKFSIVE